MQFFPKQKIIICATIILVLVVSGIIYFFAFAVPQINADTEFFVVPLSAGTDQVVKKLQSEGFIKRPWALKFALGLRGGDIEPGGYEVSKSMGSWRLAGVFSKEPYMKWIVIPEGLRKEEIADILAKKLDWASGDKEKWIREHTTARPDYFEGVYFPDTYLIPIDEAPLKVAERLQAKFQEKFAPFAKEALKQNIKWDTALKIASLVQREAAGKSDMPLIAGILWNRLLKGMRLEVDATLQYARGKTDKGWWAPIKVADKQIDSPYNTYKNKGLPPHPIANPGIDAISAVLHPEETKCFYYIHDNSKQIHCAETYEEHEKNIEKYLR